MTLDRVIHEQGCPDRNVWAREGMHGYAGSDGS